MRGTYHIKGLNFMGYPRKIWPDVWYIALPYLLKGSDPGQISHWTSIPSVEQASSGHVWLSPGSTAEVKANVRITGCAIHHFPSDKARGWALEVVVELREAARKAQESAFFLWFQRSSTAWCGFQSSTVGFISIFSLDCDGLCIPVMEWFGGIGLKCGQKEWESGLQESEDKTHPTVICSQRSFAPLGPWGLPEPLDRFSVQLGMSKTGFPVNSNPSFDPYSGK